MSSNAQAIASLTLLLSLVLSASQAQSSWTITPVPVSPTWSSAALNDAAMISSQDAWAVGEFRLAIPPYSSEGHTLAMHWDGSSWSQVPTPSPAPYPGGAENQFHAVDAVGSNDVWAGGERYGNAGGVSNGAWIHVQHWDGTSWSEIPVPAPPGGTTINFSGTRIYEVLALGANDVWFGGAWATPNLQQATLDWHPLAMHWDGSSMNIHPTPVIYDGGSGFGFRSVSMSALAPNDIWAACSKNSASGASLLNVILHWDGSSWSQVAVPNGSVNHTLHSIEAISPNDIWVFGEISFSTAPYILHYDGASWTEIATGPSATAAYAFGPGDIYAAKSSVSHFDGTSWSVQATFPGYNNPSVLALDSDGTSGILAVGRYVTSSFQPLAALRSDIGLTATATPRPACLYPAPAQSLVAATLPVIGQTLYLHSGDPTSAALLTPGSQSFLLLATQPYPGAGCGLPVPGFGVGTTPGEAMIDFAITSLILTEGPRTWSGPGSPAIHPLPIPALSWLVGITVHAQAVILDPIGLSAPGIVTETLDLQLGL